jgi:hypothetical protein
MSLEIPNYPDPQAPDPIAKAYSWISFLALDFTAPGGRIVHSVHRSAVAAQATPPYPPVSQIAIGLGEVLVPAVLDADGQVKTPAVTFPTLAEAMQDPEFAAAWGVIRGKLYAWSRRHPLLAQATDTL